MNTIYAKGLKRIFGFVLSLLFLMLLSPLMLILIIAIRLDSPGSAIFTQKRIGKNKKEFNILKFRTMRTDTPKNMPTHMLKDADRYITRTGKFLRKTSLDELPQLINILKGDMSIVGPRPALWNQYDLINLRDANGANLVRPGLTGWAQINGRDELSLAKKAYFDGEYVKNISALFDIKCVFLTFFKVVRSDGVHEGGVDEDEERAAGDAEQAKAAEASRDSEKIAK